MENFNFFPAINLFRFSTFCDLCIDDTILVLQSFNANKTVITSKILLDLTHYKVLGKFLGEKRFFFFWNKKHVITE